MNALSVIREIIFYFLNGVRALLGGFYLLLGIVCIVALGVLGIGAFQGLGGSSTPGVGFLIVFIVVILIIALIPMFFAIVAYLFPVLFAIIRLTVYNPTAKFVMALINVGLLLLSSVGSILSGMSGLFNTLADLVQSNSSSYYYSSSMTATETVFASIVMVVFMIASIIKLILCVVLLTLTLIVDIHMLKYGNIEPEEEEYEIGSLDNIYGFTDNGGYYEEDQGTPFFNE